ncbi:hypothetical protein [Corynebacterium parakroppenstedtii]|uniref:hypothetical protein n=1 Tax=Corynebacterium parakroppenstedtii TaxID=2828363 RepID=UPI001C8E81D3|nr:hypothetical protein [Corynebacterium parakroppenstedtii]MBY0797269.1 hypothetical protein [Corynebacterium parakroppenstedtii]
MFGEDTVRELESQLQEIDHMLEVTDKATARVALLRERRATVKDLGALTNGRWANVS